MDTNGKQTRCLITNLVKESENELKKMTTQQEVYLWAEELNINSRADFQIVINALFDMDINYNILKSKKNPEPSHTIPNIQHQLQLFVSGSAISNSFAINDKNGNILWWTSFSFTNPNCNFSDWECKLYAAKNAIDLVIQIKNAMNLPSLKLKIYTEAQYLTHNNKPHHKGYALIQWARQNNIELIINWIKSANNPAYSWAIESEGCKEIDEQDFIDLIESIPYK